MSIYSLRAASLTRFLDAKLLVEGEGWSAYPYGYDSSKDRIIEPLYTEITGYGVSMSLWLGRRAEAERLATFIEKAGAGRGPALYGYYPSKSRWSGRIYVFDNGVVARSLLQLHRATGNDGFLDHAERILSWIIGMQEPSGWFHAGVTYPDGLPLSHSEWYGDGGCLHGKLMIPLLDAWRLTGRDEYLDSATRLMRWLLSLQHGKGFIEARPGAGYVFHHAHCYAVEGLLYAWSVLGGDALFEAVEKAAGWLAHVQLDDGGIPEKYPYGVRFRVASDATAQAARIWLLMYRLTGEHYWVERALKALDYLARLPGGGLPAYTTRIGPVSRPSPRTHTWSLMFAVQAFSMAGLLGGGARDMVEAVF